ncbi:tryptophan synthase subunit alpha [Geomicrobium sp. JCM 19055]|uniref:tryptophan synthase subunit alpha n=1 Tax=Geomicrobium sp. JCM 19055 TaxID=1460649 RepID=UPI00045ED4C3|nr:tryptophan synthase subunit alpha [Geomicrobium sp. JCM 19055]GAJ98753.1 tryptophan synthase alpha chain [Geomicrobium sp. JCM 19055]
MMNRVEAAANNNDQLFIPYIVAGDPTIEVTIDLARVLEESGAHILELGVPYSDPLADGPVIQAAANRSLQEGTSLQTVIDTVRQIRAAGIQIPIVLFCYVNPILKYGLHDAVKAASEAGVDGWLVPDLPYEENDEMKKTCNEYGNVLISLVAPTSNERVKRIAKEAQGFLYCVSSLGVTGVREEFDHRLDTFITAASESSSVPLAVGFGVSKREHVARLHTQGYGAVVGSRIVKEIEKYETMLRDPHQRSKALLQIKTFVQSLVSS